MDKVHYSSENDEWETPWELFIKYDKIYKFDLDVCASKENSKCEEWIDKTEDALKLKWHKITKTKTVWCNPPYSNVKDWIKKAYEESLSGITIVMLIPARTDTIAWHDYIFPHARIEFLKGRLKFSNSKNNAPFPSAIVIFEGKNMLSEELIKGFIKNSYSESIQGNINKIIQAYDFFMEHLPENNENNTILHELLEIIEKLEFRKQKNEL